MLRDEMFHHLHAVDHNDRIPVWVISYNRYDAPTLTRMNEWERLDDVHVVVRESQVAEYRRAFPALQFEPLPDERVLALAPRLYDEFHRPTALIVKARYQP